MAIPDSITCKIFRAVKHLKEFEAESHQYFQTNPGKVIRQREGDPDQFIGKLETTGPIPARFPLIIGDCLQNLRSSLDYLVWELVLAAKNNPGKHNMFPICPTPESFNAQLAKLRRLEGVPVDTIAEIKALQPYHCGQDFDKSTLRVIDDLCNINKHRRILLTHLHGGIAPKDMETRTVDGQLWVKADLASMKQDAKIGPFPIVEGAQGRGLQVETNLYVLAFIAFNEGAAQNMQVGVLLANMVQYIDKGIVARFEKFFG